MNKLKDQTMKTACRQINFSIITIVYNDAFHIKETMDSILNQSYKDIEYILIDGGSTDGTCEKILECIHSCATITQEDKSEDRLYLEATHNTFPALTFKFLSQKDKGIYDAMNKGVALATKEWINFMNCGDRFYALDILQKVANEDLGECHVIYGDTEIIDCTRSYIQHSSPTIKKRMPFCHQSSFTLNTTFSSFLFDISYKICADNDLFMKLHSLKYKFKKVNFPISTYTLDGISASPSWQMFIEECKIGYKYNKFFPIYLGIKWLLWTVPKKQIKKIYP